MEAWNSSRKEPLKTFALTDNKDSEHAKLIEKTGPIEPLVFNRVAVGGTFDHIHAGHKILLTMTALLSTKSMVVGVTGKLSSFRIKVDCGLTLCRRLHVVEKET